MTNFIVYVCVCVCVCVQCLYQACARGLVQVVKLLVSTLSDVDLPQLLLCATASLDKHLTQQATPPTDPPISSGSPSEPMSMTLEEGLTSVARYLYHMDPAHSQTVLTRSADKFPRATLYLLHTLHLAKKRENKNIFYISGIGLTSAPSSWLDHTHFTHVSLDHNQLASVPVELFQLPLLYRLKLSNNCLEAIPDILKWNCPKLKDLDLAYNRLQTRPFVILEGRRPSKEPSLDSNLPSIGKQRNMLNAAQAVLALTGYNLYPCICSLTRVSISHNATLEQVRWVWLNRSGFV